MSGLLPDVIRDAIGNRSVYSASESFGVVTLALLVFLLLEREGLRLAGAGRARLTVLSAVVAPLLVAVVLTIVFRIEELI